MTGLLRCFSGLKISVLLLCLFVTTRNYVEATPKYQKHFHSYQYICELFEISNRIVLPSSIKQFWKFWACLDKHHARFTKGQGAYTKIWKISLRDLWTVLTVLLIERGSEGLRGIALKRQNSRENSRSEIHEEDASIYHMSNAMYNLSNTWYVLNFHSSNADSFLMP